MNKKKLEIVPMENKKDEQIFLDMQRTPAERWIYMWHLIDLAIAFSPTRTLKFVNKHDGFITLKRKNASA